MPEDDQEPPAGRVRGPWLTPGRIAAALAAFFVVASVAAVAVPVLRATVDSPEVEMSPFGSTVVCLPALDAKDSCDRQSADLARRAPISETERAKASALLDQVSSALPRGGAGRVSCDGAAGVCSMTRTAPSVEQVLRALRGAGYQDAVVHVAGPADPAPAGTVLIAVPFGSACVMLSVGGQGRTGTVTGQLPDGRCLDP